MRISVACVGTKKDEHTLEVAQAELTDVDTPEALAELKNHL